MDAADTRPARVRAAAAARALIVGQITWDDLVAAFGDSDDPRITELLEFIQSEPEVGGFAGVSQLQYRAYRAALDRLIVALERER
jgi:hypothetical protein